MKRTLTTVVSGLAVALVATLGLGSGEVYAQAQGLAAVGPSDPGNGFPQFYQDKTGRALEPCLDSLNPADPCGIVATVPNPTQPIVFPTNFPDEFFYWMANARMKPVAGSSKFRADLTLALEGAFGNVAGTVANGDQITFARFRFRVTGGLVRNATYTLTYPYGIKTFVA